VSVRHVNVEGIARLPAFSHAAVAGDTVYVAGTLGTADGELELVGGGAEEQTAQALRHIERILAACGASLDDVVKMNVYLTDMSQFEQMNEAYTSFFSGDPPARITVGCSELALGAVVEIDCVAVRPS
jgi:2-iminobutanoate/2-iminopropanoate deaminase